jgi:DNA-binding MarR family transcriptional regulator
MKPKHLTFTQYKAWRSFHQMRTQLLGYLVRRLYQHSHLTEAEYIILIVLYESKKPIRIKEMSQIMNWEMSRLSHQITRMEAVGLLQKKVCEEDPRRFEIKITDKGRTMIQKAFPLQELEIKHCFGDILTEDQLNSLIEISGVICKHLEEEHEA